MKNKYYDYNQQYIKISHQVDYEWEMYKRSMPEHSEICDEAMEYVFKWAFKRASDLYRGANDY